MHWKRWVAVLVSSCLLASQAQALDDLKTDRFTLENGLRVVVLKHPRAPIVTHMLWFSAGGADEPRGKSGVAHFLEHMMFKGTPKHPDDSYSKIVEGMGGKHNAFTSDDFTAYYATVSKEHLPELMALEADRVMHIAPPKASYPSERDVVLEERRMRTDNNPSARLGEHLDARLLAPHPYAIPVIGWSHEIAALEQKDVMAFYHQHYTPKNAILLLVGDVDVAQAKRLAQRYYAQWRAPVSQTTSKPRIWPDPKPVSHLLPTALYDKTVQQWQWQRQYVAPSFGYGDTKQAFPLIVLSEMLCGGTTSALHKALVVDQKKASSVNCGYSAFARGPAGFEVEIIPEVGVSSAEIASAYEKAVSDFLEQKDAPDVLLQVQNRLKVESIYARDGVAGMAFVLGQLLMTEYDIDFFNAWPENIMRVRWEDVVKAGRNVLQQAPSATGWILPEKSAEAARRGESHE